MKKRKLELVLVILAVAVVAFLFGKPPAPEKSPAPERPPAANATMPKLQLSDDAKWIVTTAADSYTPRVPVEKAWSKSEPGIPRLKQNPQ